MLTSRTCPQSHLSAARKVCCGTLTRNAHGMLSWMTVACNIGNSAFAHPFVSRALPGFTWVTIRAGTARLPVHGLLPSLPPVMRSAGVLQHARVFGRGLSNISMEVALFPAVQQDASNVVDDALWHAGSARAIHNQERISKRYPFESKGLITIRRFQEVG